MDYGFDDYGRIKSKSHHNRCNPRIVFSTGDIVSVILDTENAKIMCQIKDEDEDTWDDEETFEIAGMMKKPVT